MWTVVTGVWLGVVVGIASLTKLSHGIRQLLFVVSLVLAVGFGAYYCHARAVLPETQPVDMSTPTTQRPPHHEHDGEGAVKYIHHGVSIRYLEKEVQETYSAASGLPTKAA